MSDCDRIQSLMSDFLENEIEPAAAASVRSHLEHCGNCSSVAARVSRMQTLFSASPVYRTSNHFDQQLRSRISKDGSTVNSRSGYRNYAYALSVVVFAFFLYWGTGFMDTGTISGTTQEASTIQQPVKQTAPVQKMQAGGAPVMYSQEGVDIKTKAGQNQAVDSLKMKNRREDPNVKYVDH
jgi:anti-sigma factor RsiW